MKACVPGYSQRGNYLQSKYTLVSQIHKNSFKDKDQDAQAQASITSEQEKDWIFRNLFNFFRQGLLMFFKVSVIGETGRLH